MSSYVCTPRCVCGYDCSFCAVLVVASNGALTLVACRLPCQIRKDATHNDGNLVYCANVGDCRCVLSRRGKAIELSMDHKPSRPDEQARIVAAGGWVHNNRIHGVLSVSRAFGDVEHKRLKTKSWEKEFVSDPLIATPEIQSERLGEDDEFMIIACDGLWDVMTSQQAVNFVRRRLYVRVGCLCGMASA